LAAFASQFHQARLLATSQAPPWEPGGRLVGRRSGGAVLTAERPRDRSAPGVVPA
jgi:hypothetical protein